jgi:5-formyltetrahydrofolate cyclo-ligase
MGKTQKQILRTHASELLKALPWQRRRAAGFAAVAELQEKLAQFKHVLSFTSFGTEIDLWPLNARLAKEKRLCFPYFSLKIFEVESLSSLHPGKNPNLEPDPSRCREIALEEIDCILTPALLFDSQGYRLGFGGGFYDKLLKDRKKETPILGIGYKEQLSKDPLPNEAHDIPVDELLLF